MSKNITLTIMEKKNSAIKIQRFLCASVIFLSLLFSYYLFHHLISHIYYIKAVNLINKGNYVTAITLLEKAIRHEVNDSLIWKTLGKAYHLQGRAQPLKKAITISNRAKDAYLKATRINPLDSEAFFGLAREEYRLEQIYSFMGNNRKNNPFHASPYFKKAIHLRPNSTTYHYIFARYLHWKNKNELLQKVVTNLGHIYPPIYDEIKKESFFSPKTEKAFMSGLKQAIEEKICIREAYMTMSAILADKDNWTDAISNYRAAMLHKPNKNNLENDLHLGYLYLENGQLEAAERSFIKVLSLSDNRDNTLEGLYRFYKKKGYSKQFFDFFQKSRKSLIISSRSDILFARSLIDLKEYEQAKKILAALNQRDQLAESYFLSAHIAEKEKDWDSMELAIQKATILEPDNSWYHFRFSKVLSRLKKFARAEKEAGLAIKHYSAPPAWMFNNRGWIRWNRKDYLGAIKDWKYAIGLNPQKASYYIYVAQAYQKIGEWSRAMEYYQDAIKLDPDNKDYQKKYRELKKD